MRFIATTETIDLVKRTISVEHLHGIGGDFCGILCAAVAKRKVACEAELAVNRRFAPEIYLRLVAITRQNGRLALDGPGEPVEWAVEMRRFDENATLDHLADQGRIDAALADALARA